MTPITWNVNAKSALLDVDSNGLRVNYIGPGKNNEDAVICTNQILLQCKLFYFEIEIINNDKNGIIAIGFCTKSAELTKLPGCGKNSWGYHSDDGNFFDCSETEEPYGPTFKAGDTIGCCLNFRNNSVLYTKNGVNLGIAFRDLKKDLEQDPYYPCIGIRSKRGPISIEANFGNKKFKYTAITDDDIDDDQLKEKWIKALKQYDNKDKDMIEDFKKSLENNQITVRLRYSAKAYFIMGEYEKALEDLKKLLEIEEEKKDRVKDTVQNLFGIKKYSKAYSNIIFALRYRGETYLILSKYEESNTDLKNLLEINKDNKWASQASNEVDRR